MRSMCSGIEVYGIREVYAFFAKVFSRYAYRKSLALFTYTFRIPYTDTRRRRIHPSTNLLGHLNNSETSIFGEERSASKPASLLDSDNVI
jgi:hypothetical protein